MKKLILFLTVVLLLIIVFPAYSIASPKITWADCYAVIVTWDDNKYIEDISGWIWLESSSRTTEPIKLTQQGQYIWTADVVIPEPNHWYAYGYLETPDGAEYFPEQKLVNCGVWLPRVIE